MIRTQKHKDRGTHEGQRQLIDSGLITSDEKQLGHIYDNADLFPTLPNAAYGTAAVGKALCWHTLQTLSVSCALSTIVEDCVKVSAL